MGNRSSIALAYQVCEGAKFLLQFDADADRERFQKEHQDLFYIDKREIVPTKYMMALRTSARRAIDLDSQVSHEIVRVQ